MASAEGHLFAGTSALVVQYPGATAYSHAVIGILPPHTRAPLHLRAHAGTTQASTASFGATRIRLGRLRVVSDSSSPLADALSAAGVPVWSLDASTPCIVPLVSSLLPGPSSLARAVQWSAPLSAASCTQIGASSCLLSVDARTATTLTALNLQVSSECVEPPHGHVHDAFEEAHPDVRCETGGEQGLTPPTLSHRWLTVRSAHCPSLALCASHGAAPALPFGRDVHALYGALVTFQNASPVTLVIEQQGVHDVGAARIALPPFTSTLLPLFDPSLSASFQLSWSDGTSPHSVRALLGKVSTATPGLTSVDLPPAALKLLRDSGAPAADASLAFIAVLPAPEPGVGAVIRVQTAGAATAAAAGTHASHLAALALPPVRDAESETNLPLILSAAISLL
ncbi:MAG: hypothetical protein EOO41_04460, partial [Methanobacteriota archaeon]